MPYIPKEPNRPWTPDDKKSSSEKKTDPFYLSTAWRKLRKAFLADNPICVECKLKDRVREAKVVDHIVPRAVAPEKELDWNNLQGLCVIHHNKKTQEDRKRYKL